MCFRGCCRDALSALTLHKGSGNIDDFEFEYRIEFLGAVPLFVKQLPSEEIPRVARALTWRHYKSGQMLVQAGDFPAAEAAFFLVAAGEATLEVEVDGTTEVRGYLLRGDYFGGNTLIEQRPYIASVRAAGQSGVSVYSLSKAQFEELGFHRTLKLPKRAAIYKGFNKTLSLAKRPVPDFGKRSDLRPEDEAILVKGVMDNPTLHEYVELREEAIRQVARSARRVEVERGTTIFHGGDFGTELYVIKSGIIEVIPSQIKASSSLEFTVETILEPRKRKQVLLSKMLQEPASDTMQPESSRQSSGLLETGRTRSGTWTSQARGLSNMFKGNSNSGKISYNSNSAQLTGSASLSNSGGNFGKLFSANSTGIMPRLRRMSLFDGSGEQAEPSLTAEMSAAPRRRRMSFFAAAEPEKAPFDVGQWVSRRALEGEEQEAGRIIEISGMQVKLEFPLTGQATIHADELEAAEAPSATLKLRPGEVFGEVAVLYNLRRVATCRVSDDQDAVILAIGGDDLKAAIGHSMMQEEKFNAWVELLDTVPALSSMLKAERVNLAKNASGELYFKPGELSMEEGKPVAAWHIIMSGTAQVSTKCHGQLTELHHGCHYGEYGLLNTGLAHASVVAGENGLLVLAIDGEILKNLSLCEDFLDTKCSIEEYYQPDIMTKRSGSINVEMERPARCGRSRLSREYTVHPDTLVPVCVLGSGNFSQVTLLEKDSRFSSARNGVKDRYALKRTSKRLVRKMTLQSQICNERHLLSLMGSDFVIRLYCCYQDRRYVYMLMEAVLGGTLEAVVDRNPKGLPAAHVRFYVGCITLGLEHMHDRHIAHRDIKPGNILLDENGWPKICDVGFARFIIDKSYTMLGTPAYMAPEILDFPNKHDRRVDWWALGVMTFELLTGAVPWSDSGANEGQRCLVIRRNQKRMPYPDFSVPVPAAAHQLVEALLAENPHRRLGHEDQQVSQHYWFNDGFFMKALAKHKVDPPLLDLPPLDLSRKPPNEFESDEHFDRIEDSEWWRTNIAAEEGRFRKNSGDKRGYDSFAVTKLAGAVRITFDPRGSTGIVRFGLVRDPSDDYKFDSGYQVGRLPYLPNERLDETSYLVPGSCNDILTLTIDDDQVLVYRCGEKVHSMGRVKKKEQLYAKIFVHQIDESAIISAFWEPPDDSSNWDAAFRLPLAVTKLSTSPGRNRDPKRQGSKEMPSKRHYHLTPFGTAASLRQGPSETSNETIVEEHAASKADYSKDA
mmetsp:Transcript_20661/g.45310  ORF Transcript_20661/g.45310 Transcript_20661/m.45310 type:complete len:1236 (-) Transcript_20661:78-3785(-)